MTRIVGLAGSVGAYEVVDLSAGRSADAAQLIPGRTRNAGRRPGVVTDMQARPGRPRTGRTCAAAVLACLLTLAVIPVSAHAAGRTHGPRHLARTAVTSVAADPGPALDHSAVVPARVIATVLVRAGTADSSTTARPRTARTPPARGPPAKGHA